MTHPSRILIAMVASMFFGYMPWYGFSALTASYAGGYLVASPLAAAFSWSLGVLCISLPAFAEAFLLRLQGCPERNPISRTPGERLSVSSLRSDTWPPCRLRFSSAGSSGQGPSGLERRPVGGWPFLY